jgi:hypothetical protein
MIYTNNIMYKIKFDLIIYLLAKLNFIKFIVNKCFINI